MWNYLKDKQNFNEKRPPGGHLEFPIGSKIGKFHFYGLIFPLEKFQSTHAKKFPIHKK